MDRPTTTACPPAGGASTIRFSTADVPERERVDAWREVVGRAIIKFKIEPVPNSRFHGEIVLRGLPGLHVNKGAASGMRLQHTPALLESDDLIMNVGLGGSHLVHQRGREFAIGTGDAILMAGAEPMVHAFPSVGRLFTFCMPRNAIAPMVGNLDAVLARPIRNDTEALRLLVDYAHVVENMPTLQTPEARHLVATHIHDLVALCVGANRDGAEIAHGRGLRAARLRAIKVDIASHIAHANLSVSEIALRHRVTPRYVQMLFETEGTTFTEFVLGRRLVRAHRMLTNPHFADRSIASVAFDAGFGDLSYFNRTFRRRFGNTPSGVRMEVPRDDQ